METKQINAVESLINLLRCPVAQRIGWKFNADECSIWAEELEEFLKRNCNGKH